MSITWYKGHSTIRSAVSNWINTSDRPGNFLRNHERRQVICAQTEAGPLLIKIFKKTGKQGGLLEYTKFFLGLGAASREFSTLSRTWKVNSSIVPCPLALGRTLAGEGILVSTFHQGLSLIEALEAKDCDRMTLLTRVGTVIESFHLSGMVHRDLHAENILVTDTNIILIDLQSSVAFPFMKTPEFLRARDIGALNYSLWRHTIQSERRAMVNASIGNTSDHLSSADEKKELLRHWREKTKRCAWRHFHRHAKSRTKKANSEGRRFTNARWGRLKGLRQRNLHENDLVKILELHSRAITSNACNVIKSDQRSKLTRIQFDNHSYVVKETSCRNILRGFTDNFRGSAARRAWKAAYGLEARGIQTPRALAFVEERTGGTINRSILVLQGLDEVTLPLELARRDPQSCLSLLAESIIELHAKGVDHGDLKITNYVFSYEKGKATQAIPVDLDKMTFHRKVGYRRRIAGLAQLNASLPDLINNESRKKAFDKYCNILPFADDNASKVKRSAREQVIRTSLEKRHRWTGAGCKISKGPDT